MAIEEFNEARNLARVTAGIREAGPFYKTLLTPQPMKFVDGYPATFNEKRMGSPIKTSPIEDVWVARRSNSSMK